MYGAWTSRATQGSRNVDAISLIVGLFLAGSCTSTAESIDQGGRTYQVVEWTCEAPRQTVYVWMRQCPLTAAPSDATWWSRPFLLIDTRSGEGFYLNRFAEVMAGHQVEMDEVYVPDCGS